MCAQVLTVIAEWAAEGSHAAVTAEAIPLLQAHALIGTRVLLAGCAGPCNTIQKKLGSLFKNSKALSTRARSHIVVANTSKYMTKPVLKVLVHTPELETAKQSYERFLKFQVQDKIHYNRK